MGNCQDIFRLFYLSLSARVSYNPKSDAGILNAATSPPFLYNAAILLLDLYNHARSYKFHNCLLATQKYSATTLNII